MAMPPGSSQDADALEAMMPKVLNKCSTAARMARIYRGACRQMAERAAAAAFAAVEADPIKSVEGTSQVSYAFRVCKKTEHCNFRYSVSYFIV